MQEVKKGMTKKETTDLLVGNGLFGKYIEVIGGMEDEAAN